MSSLRFCWGSNDKEGSDHMVDHQRYAMELQLIFRRCSWESTELSQLAKPCSVVVISYLFKVRYNHVFYNFLIFEFQVTTLKNLFLEKIILYLHQIQNPCESHNIQPFPMHLIAPSFKRGYFSYNGSLTHSPCAKNVKWIVCGKLLHVSSNQIQKF